MKYKEYQDTVRHYLNKNGFVQGYISQQERTARFICREVITRFPTPYELSLEKGIGCGNFYQLFAKIPLDNCPSYGVCIGSFTNDQTIRKQTIGFRLNEIDKYGDEEFTRAVRMVAMDFLHKKLEGDLKAHAEKEAMADAAHEEVEKTANTHAEISISLMSPDDIRAVMGDFAKDRERRAMQKLLEEQMVHDAPKEPVRMHPVGDSMFCLTSGRCHKKSWINFKKEQEWTVSYLEGDAWTVERDGVVLHMATFDIMQHFGQVKAPA